MAIDYDEVKSELDEGTAQLVDVREQDEWDEGHISGAKLVPLSELQTGFEPEDLDSSKKTYLYCRSGNRVFQAEPLFLDLGFDDVVPLEAGFAELVEKGYIKE